MCVRIWKRQRRKQSQVEALSYVPCTYATRQLLEIDASHTKEYKPTTAEPLLTIHLLGACHSSRHWQPLSGREARRARGERLSLRLLAGLQVVSFSPNPASFSTGKSRLLPPWPYLAGSPVFPSASLRGAERPSWSSMKVTCCANSRYSPIWIVDTWNWM